MSGTGDSVAKLRQDFILLSKTISELVQAESKRQDREKSEEEIGKLKESYRAEDIKRLNTRIDAIYSTGRWVLATAGSALILAIATFTIRGGFFNG